MAKYGDIGKARQTSRQARRVYEFIRPGEIDSGEVTHYPVIIAGGGPIGLATAIDLARHGIQSVVLEKYNTVSDGSRAICWAKRTLEILDRLGSSDRMMEKGVVWNQGWVYFGGETEPIYKFDLLPDKDQKFPRVHQPAAVLCRGVPDRPVSGIPGDGNSLAKRGGRCNQRYRQSHRDDQYSCRGIPAQL